MKKLPANMLNFKYKKIAFLVAFNDEVDLSLVKKWSKKNVSSMTLYHNKTAKKEYFLIITGAGKTNAAIATTYLIHVAKVDAIINIGTAGKHTGNLYHNQIALISKSTYGDVDATEFGYKYGQLPQGLNYYSINNSFNDQIKLYLLTYFKNNLKINCTVATSDSFINQKNQIHYHLTKSIHLVDMEANSINQVCYLSKFKNIAIIKVVSDIVNETKNQWQETIDITKKTITDVIKSLII